MLVLKFKRSRDRLATYINSKETSQEYLSRDDIKDLPAYPCQGEVCKYFMSIFEQYPWLVSLLLLTIVSRKSKKKQRLLSELFTMDTIKKLANALAKLP